MPTKGGEGPNRTARSAPCRIATVLVVAALALAGGPARGQNTAPPAAAQKGGAALTGSDAPGFWEALRMGTLGALDYGFGAVRSFSGWVTGSAPGSDEVRADDIRSLLSLSEKEFREFDSLVRQAGYGLQGYSFGLNGSSEVELVFDFEHALADRERTELRHLLDQQGVISPVRRNIVLALLEASRYVDASPAGGYRLATVVMRLSTPLDVRVSFRRLNKP